MRNLTHHLFFHKLNLKFYLQYRGKSLKRLLLFLMILISFGSCEKDFSGIKNPAELKGTIYGKVLDQTSQLPIPEAAVLAVNNEINDTTNSSGNFKLEGLEPSTEIILVCFKLLPLF